MLFERGMDMIGLSFIFSLFLVGGTFSLIPSLQAIHDQGALVNGRARRQVRISFNHRHLFLHRANVAHHHSLQPQSSPRGKTIEHHCPEGNQKSPIENPIGLFLLAYDLAASIKVIQNYYAGLHSPTDWF